MPPRQRAIRPMRMRNKLRAAVGVAVLALLAAGCGSNPVPPPVMAHGVAVREPLVDPRPYGMADMALGREVPAGKYSPSMDLHPMFRADVAAKDAAFLHSWTA